MHYPIILWTYGIYSHRHPHHHDISRALAWSHSVAARAHANLFVRRLRRLLDSSLLAWFFFSCSRTLLYIFFSHFFHPAVFGCSGPQVYLLLASDAPRFLSSSSSQHVPFSPPVPCIPSSASASLHCMFVSLVFLHPHTLRHTYRLSTQNKA